MAYKVTTGPSAEPLTLNEVKQHLKVTYNNEDALLGAMIIAAREEAEDYTGLALMQQTIEESFNCFPGYDVNNVFSSLWLSVSPIIGIDTIKYKDTDNNDRTLSATQYIIDDKSKPGSISPAYNASWPTTANVKNAITITYRAGFGANPGDVPNTIKQAMLLMIGNWYEKRSDDPQTPFQRKVGNAQWLLDRHRINLFV